MEKETIEITKAWFETLLKYAEAVDKAIGDDHNVRVKYKISYLLGYISSAETFLKLSKKENGKPKC